MPKPRSEEDKKHGDKMESLIGRTGGASREERDDGADDEDAAQHQDDDEDLQNEDGEDGPDSDERQ
jgi:hypothetical protein